jgi:hypothetical protein
LLYESYQYSVICLQRYSNEPQPAQLPYNYCTIDAGQKAIQTLSAMFGNNYFYNFHNGVLKKRLPAATGRIIQLSG